MKSQILKSTLIAAAGLLFSGAALADTATGSIAVTATVANSCIVSASALDFSAYNAEAQGTGTSVITATCSAATPYTIGLGVGVNIATGPSTRAMIGNDTATTALDYELYTADSEGTIWTEEVTVPHSDLLGGAKEYTVYGKIPAGQYVPAADYTDTVAVTVTY